MNILMVTPYFPPQTGGVVTFTDSLQRLLRERGHQLYVIVPGSSHSITPCVTPTNALTYDFYFRSLWIAEAPVKSLFAFLVYFIPTLFKLRRFLKKNNVDLVLLEYPMPYMFYFYLLKLLVKMKIIVGIHGSDVLSLQLTPKHEQWLVRQIVRRADWLLAHSSSLMSQAETVIGQLNDNRSYIPYGIELERWRCLSGNKTEPLVLPVRPYILTVAKLHERKGLNILLYAIKKLGNEVAGYHFVIVGNGPEEMALKQLALRLGIQDSVVFTGELQRQEIIKLYQNCEFFVLPSRSEPFGIVLLEAMVFGKAIIATKVGGIPEFITDGFNGILVPPDNPSALAESITHLIRDPELGSTIGKNGPALVENRYNFRVIVDRYEKLFQQITTPETTLNS